MFFQIVMAMMAGIVLVGGLTRLTQSGLSITEWKPVTGALPPLSDADWQAGFDWWRGSVVDDARRFLETDQRLAVSTQSGATDDEDFPGWAALLKTGGEIVTELPDWRTGVLVVNMGPSASYYKA